MSEIKYTGLYIIFAIIQWLALAIPNSIFVKRQRAGRFATKQRAFKLPLNFWLDTD
jgi:hypothetical protein